MKTNKLSFTIILIIYCALFSNLNAQSSTPVTKDQIPSKQTNIRINKNIVQSKSDFLPSNIKIVESQSYNSGHTMDSVWKMAALSRGQIATIVPQTIFSDTSWFNTTDVLIISSGVITLPSNAVDIIKRFVMRRKNVYIQGEYLSSYTTNQAFQSLVTALGGSFSWGLTISGNLAPMNVIGSLSTYPNTVTSFPYFWYGVYGTGNSTIENYLMYANNFYGFIFTPPNPNYGRIITNSDQDWVRTDTCMPLLQNIIYRLTTLTEIRKIESGIPNSFSLSQNYPNPFNPVTKIKFDITQNIILRESRNLVTLKIYDILGRERATLVNEQLQPGSYEVSFDGSNYSSGVYYYKLSAGTYTNTKKMLMIK